MPIMTSVLLLSFFEAKNITVTPIIKAIINQDATKVLPKKKPWIMLRSPDQKPLSNQPRKKMLKGNNTTNQKA